MMFPRSWRQIVVALLLFFPSLALSQSATLTGKVVDAATGEPLIGANVLLVGKSKGTTTNLDGLYTIKDLTAGNYDLQVSYVSYTKKLVKNVLNAPN